MLTPTVIILIGFLIFLGHYLAELFNRTKIPDVVGLLAVGLLLGPGLHLFDPQSFGQAGRVFTNIVLVFILFESGLEVHFEELRLALRGTFTLTTLNFLVTTLLVAALAQVFTSLDLLGSCILGSIVGGTSSAVVTTLSRKARVREHTRTMLVMESAFSDVYTLGVPISLMSFYVNDSLSLGSMFGQMVLSLVLAVLAGAGGAVAWSLLQERIPTLLKTRFSTPAFVFILYGLVEYFDFSGPIAVLCFSVLLANLPLLRASPWLRYLPLRRVEMTRHEKSFFAELVFLLRTFFFVYVGMSIVLQNAQLIWLGVGATLLLFVVRIPVVKAATDQQTPLLDASLMSIMIPKGLGAAVLATLPLQRGLPGGLIIQTVTFAVILSTTLLCTLLFFLLERGYLAGFYRVFFGAGPPPAPAPEFRPE